MVVSKIPSNLDGLYPLKYSPYCTSLLNGIYADEFCSFFKLPGKVLKAAVVALPKFTELRSVISSVVTPSAACSAPTSERAVCLETTPSQGPTPIISDQSLFNCL